MSGSSSHTPLSLTPRTDDIRRMLLRKYPDPIEGEKKLLYYMEAAECYAQECLALEREHSSERGLKLSKLERQMVCRAIGFATAGEWPWEPYKKREGEALASANKKIAEAK